MDKKDLSERDICTKYITPALKKAGWDIHSQIREEVTLTAGRVIVKGQMGLRAKGKRADYVLYHKPNMPLAVVEAKDNKHSVGAGMQQAQGYADGKTVTNQPKRGVMFHVVKPIIDSGVKPEQVADIIFWRKKNLFYCFNEELNEEQVIARLTEENKGGAVPKHRRYFSKEDELFHIDGKTYLLTNQWGLKTLEAVALLKNTFTGIEVEVVPVSK